MNNQEYFASEPQEETSLSEEEYLYQAMNNLHITSRTAKGTIDVSASSLKAKDMQMDQTKNEIADRVIRNFSKVLQYLYKKRNFKFKNPQKLRNFIEDIARRINKDITREEVLYRSGTDSSKYPYTKINDLQSAMVQFCQELFIRLQGASQDPKELAGWVEYRIDLSDHFFADGCGTTAKAVSSWILMQAGHSLPKYHNREELYQNAPTQITGQNAEIDRIQLERWLSYYKTLF